MSSTVVLKSKGAEEFRATLPNGKELFFRFKSDGNGAFVAEIPTVIKYRDDFNKERTFSENYAQDLLNGYPHLEVVEVKKDESVVRPVVTKKKGKKHEEAVS